MITTAQVSAIQASPVSHRQVVVCGSDGVNMAALRLRAARAGDSHTSLVICWEGWERQAAPSPSLIGGRAFVRLLPRRWQRFLIGSPLLLRAPGEQVEGSGRGCVGWLTRSALHSVL